MDAASGLVVVAEASDVTQAIALAEQRSPDAILVGASTLARADDIATAALRAAQPGSCIFIVGGDEECGSQLRLASENPVAIGEHRSPIRRLPPEAGVQEFFADVGEIFGIRCEDCRLQSICPVARAVTALTRRERQVAVRVAAGLTSKQIATVLGLAIRTVNTYRESLSRKLGASSAAALTRYVIESGLRDIVGNDPEDPRTSQLSTD
jgi:DNA-binding NarL/FixJ family response regulator